MPTTPTKKHFGHKRRAISKNEHDDAESALNPQNLLSKFSSLSVDPKPTKIRKTNKRANRIIINKADIKHNQDSNRKNENLCSKK
mmetsp:Transcript_37245/g.32936  ORF Transcript_37245/g.32936 Transcript_37245/m.32936 type:complete len:85 (-) Transcript_37245:9-263(-)